MSNMPNDPEFVTAARRAIFGHVAERVIFIDTDNQLRYEIYWPEFSSGRILEVRELLEERGVLKGMVYVAAKHLGPGSPFLSVIEHLPSKAIFSHMSDAGWVESSAFDEAVEKYRCLFANGEEHDTQD